MPNQFVDKEEFFSNSKGIASALRLEKVLGNSVFCFILKSFASQ
jgi:hypothetical protein